MRTSTHPALPAPHLATLPCLLETSYSLPCTPDYGPYPGQQYIGRLPLGPCPLESAQRTQLCYSPRHKEPPKELESASSDEENEDGDFTVYECPGLAPVSALGVWRGLSAGASSRLVSGLATRSLTECLHRQGRWRCATHCLTTPRCQHQCLAPIPHRHYSDS